MHGGNLKECLSQRKIAQKRWGNLELSYCWMSKESFSFPWKQTDRITDFLIKNKFIQFSIQKGVISKESGCIEHTGILSQLIKEAKQEKKNLVITWLDSANAYDSIPHKVIKTTPEAAHVPEKTQTLITSYYNDVKIRFSTKDITAEWQKLEKGTITGCILRELPNQFWKGQCYLSYAHECRLKYNKENNQLRAKFWQQCSFRYFGLPDTRGHKNN